LRRATIVRRMEVRRLSQSRCLEDGLIKSVAIVYNRLPAALCREVLELSARESLRELHLECKISNMHAFRSVLPSSHLVRSLEHECEHSSRESSALLARNGSISHSEDSSSSYTSDSEPCMNTYKPLLVTESCTLGCSHCTHIHIQSRCCTCLRNAPSTHTCSRHRLYP